MAQSKRNVSIQLIRIVAMMMIITDHLLYFVNFQGKSIIVQISNSGVMIFLFISGYLYGNRQINNWKNWFVNRLIRICIPVWIFVIIDLIIEQLLYGRFQIKYILIYLFNVQGFVNGTPGGLPLWFITLILICYLITPLLYKLKKTKISRVVKVLIIALIIIIQIALAYITDIGMVYGHKLSWCIIAIGVYAIGFFVGEKIVNDKQTIRKDIVITLIAVATSVCVVIMNKKIDNTILYNDVIMWYGIIVVDLWIVTIFYRIGNISWIKHCIAIVNYLDKISFEFYIVHYLIIMAVTLPIGTKIGMIRYILLTLLLSIVGGTILHYICEPIIKILKERLIKEKNV